MTHRHHLRWIVLLALTPTLVLGQVSAPTDRLQELTLEEKSLLITGQNTWETHAVDRLNIPAVWMADGPVGLRKASGAMLSDSEPATCFPAAAAMAATWSPELVERVGAGIGGEARYHGVTLLLAPGLNLKRHPLGGRNFEYYSEDPLLSGLIAAAFVRGVQSQGVGATLKHFAVNNQEHLRMTIDAQLDERTLRELYLRGFEIAVKNGRPQAVMSAYNRVNGTYASQHARLLTEILRQEWGFEGLVVSDWGAVDDPVASIAAGLDLEMPGNSLTPPQVARAVQEGSLEEGVLDRAVGAVLQLADRLAALQQQPKPDVSDSNHELAREVAIASMVLLKNDGALPITLDRKLRLGVVGRLAFEPRIQGIGSSQINATRIEAPWPFLQELGASQGHTVSPWRPEYGEDGLSESQAAELDLFLQQQDLVLVFAGQKASHDAEAWDRPSMVLASADLEVIGAARRAKKPFAVVLVGGGAMDLHSFHKDADALLMGWLGGQAFGSAVAQVIFGERGPGGRLSETFAWAVLDHPSDLNFPGGPATVRYGEGLNVGYRYFQTSGRAVAYPFGHGLSYTTFEYTDARAPREVEGAQTGFDVSVRLDNTGGRAGAETVQVYLRQLEPSLTRPDRELVGFEKVLLEAGEGREVTIHIEPERLAYFHDRHQRWVVEPGRYELLVGASVADIRATLPLEITRGSMPREVYTLGHTIGELYRDARGRVVIDLLMAQQGRSPLSEAAADDFYAAVIQNLPFKRLSNFSGGALTIEALQLLLALINSDMPPGAVADTLAGMMDPERAEP